MVSTRSPITPVRSLIALSALLLNVPAAAGASRFIEGIPDFTQTQVEGAAYGNGRQFCAPAAVSNSLAWLLPQRTNQKRLVVQLASEGYMNTSLKNGTGTSGVLRGVSRYAQETFGGYRTLSYQGWRKHLSSFSTGVRVPTLPFIGRGVGKRSAAWLNVGWYKVNRTSGEYERIGGHWVTLVGYDFDKQLLILNDPAPRAGHDSSERVRFHELTGGRLVGKKTGLPTSAKGYLQLGRGMHLHPKADTAIVDGVVLFEL